MCKACDCQKKSKEKPCFLDKLTSCMTSGIASNISLCAFYIVTSLRSLRNYKTQHAPPVTDFSFPTLRLDKTRMRSKWLGLPASVVKCHHSPKTHYGDRRLHHHFTSNCSPDNTPRYLQRIPIALYLPADNTLSKGSFIYFKVHSKPKFPSLVVMQEKWTPW